MEITTGKLSETLKNAKDINSFLQENESYITNPTLQEYLKKLLFLMVFILLIYVQKIPNYGYI